MSWSISLAIDSRSLGAVRVGGTLDEQLAGALDDVGDAGQRDLGHALPRERVVDVLLELLDLLELAAAR